MFKSKTDPPYSYFPECTMDCLYVRCHLKIMASLSFAGPILFCNPNFVNDSLKSANQNGQVLSRPSDVLFRQHKMRTVSCSCKFRETAGCGKSWYYIV